MAPFQSHTAPRPPQAQRPTCNSVFIHPHALCETAKVGSDTRVWAFAHIMDGARIGRNCNIGGHSFIESGAVVGDRVTIKNGAMIWNGVTIEDDAFIGPGVLFTNDRQPRSPRSGFTRSRYAKMENWLSPTRVGRGASIGAGAVILCGLHIGAHAMIGAGALVTKDVPAQRLILGQPGRPAGWVCRCGSTLPNVSRCDSCDQTYRLMGDQLVCVE